MREYKNVNHQCSEQDDREDYGTEEVNSMISPQIFTNCVLELVQVSIWNNFEDGVNVGQNCEGHVTSATSFAFWAIYGCK